MQARQSYVSVKYNGKDITKKITDYTEGFEYVDNASGTADTVSLKLNNRSGVWWGGWIPIQGDYVEATIKTTNWNKEGDNRSLNCGYFLIDDLGYSGPPQVATIGGKVYFFCFIFSDIHIISFSAQFKIYNIFEHCRNGKDRLVFLRPGLFDRRNGAIRPDGR